MVSNRHFSHRGARREDQSHKQHGQILENNETTPVSTPYLTCCKKEHTNGSMIMMIGSGATGSISGYRSGAPGYTGRYLVIKKQA